MKYYYILFGKEKERKIILREKIGLKLGSQFILLTKKILKTGKKKKNHLGKY